MAISPNPFALKNLTLDAQELRQAISSLVPNGGGIMQAGDFAVTQTTTASMAVNVGLGRIWIPGQNTANLAGQSYSAQGMYFAFNDGPIPVPIAAASAAYPRIDVIYAYVQDSAFGAAANKIAVGVVQGAATSATPAVPALPLNVNAVSLAQVAVAVNATSITNANITATAPSVVNRPTLMASAVSPNPTYWTPFGNLVGSPITGGGMHWTGYIQLTRANTTLAISTTAYTDLGVALPTAALVGYGSVQYLRGIITGGGQYMPCTVFLNCQTGDFQVRADAAVTMQIGSFISVLVDYVQ